MQDEAQILRRAVVEVVPSEADIIAHSKPDTLYVNESSGVAGKFLNYQFDEKGGLIDISPRIRLGVFYVDDPKNDVTQFRIVKVRKVKNEWRHETESEIMVTSFGMAKIKEFCEFLNQLDIPSLAGGRIDLISSVGDDPELLRKLATLAATDKGKAALLQFVQEEITDEDFVNLAYRKEQLRIFESLLNDPTFFVQYKQQHNRTGDEAVWQHFFERNPWIFGYGLNFVWCDGVDEDRLEQVVSGFSFNESGKRADALMKTAGFIRQFVLVEIKTATAALIEKMAYRPGVWRPGDEVVGGVAQSQKTAAKFREKVLRKAELIEKDGAPKGECVYNFHPRSYLVVGNLQQFMTPTGLNEEQFCSFELYRNSTESPYIITYDELLARAKSIVEQKPKE